MARWIGALRRSAALVLGAALVASAAEATALREAVVTRVVDGDTFAVVGEAFPPDCGPSGTKRYCDTKVRVRNFDTAELRGYDCPEERALALEAKRIAAEILDGAEVTLAVAELDRYGRPVADVTVRRDGVERDFVEAMLARGAGARWRYGEEAAPDWCGAGAVAAAPEPAKSWLRSDTAEAIAAVLIVETGRWLSSLFE